MTTVIETTRPTEPKAPVSGEFTATRAELLNALTTVGASISTHPAIPVMAGVLLESEGADLLARGYDYDTSTTVRIVGAVRTSGRLLVSHAQLHKLLTVLVKGVRKRDADSLPVTVRVKDTHFATVELADSVIPLELLPVEDYPDLPEQPSVFAHVDAGQFTAETGRVLRAIGRDVTLPALTGMKIDVGDHGLTLAATDRYRLAVGHVHADVATDAPDNGALIDGALLGRILPKLTGDDIRLGYGTGPFGGLVSLESAHVSVVARLHNDGEFIKYAEILPTSTTGTVVVDRANLLTQTERAAGVLAATMSKSQNTPVTVTVSADAVRVAPHLGEGAEHVRTRALPAKVTGISEATCFGLNHVFLIDALKSFTGDTVTLHTISPTKPFLLTDAPGGLSDHTAFRHLLMPVRLTA